MSQKGHRRRILRAGCLAALLLPAGVAFAQAPETGATRAGVIAEEQREKARVAAPYEPGRVERTLQNMEEGHFPLISPPDGIYPAFGNIYPGSRLAFGGGYARWIGDRSRFDVSALYSLATYKRVQAILQSPGHANGRLGFNARVGWVDAPRIAYFGLGSQTQKADHTVFRLRATYAEGGVTWKPVRWLDFGLGADYETYDEQSGTGALPSIETLFTPATAPHLGEDPSYAKVSTSATFLWLESPLYSRRGGFFRLSYNGYERLDEEGEFGFTRTEIVQHIPILRETWVLSLRARADVLVGDDADAPYFLFPSLGSGTTLRSFQTDRFRDRHSLLLSGEWRWIPNALMLDLAFFVDAGKVGDEWRELAQGHFRKDFGVGVRFHTPTVTALRIDIAHGAEGLRFVFTTSTPF